MDEGPVSTLELTACCYQVFWRQISCMKNNYSLIHNKGNITYYSLLVGETSETFSVIMLASERDDQQ